MTTTPACQCGHEHATAEQEGTTWAFHRCRAPGCDCETFRPTPDRAGAAAEAPSDAGNLDDDIQAVIDRIRSAARVHADELLALDAEELVRLFGRALEILTTERAAHAAAVRAAEGRCEWIAAALHGDPLVGPGASDPLVQQVAALRQRAERAEAVVGEEARPLDEWDEDTGPVLWWAFPVQEPPYAGTPLDSDWPGYHTHWTPIVVPTTARAAGGDHA